MNTEIEDPNPTDHEPTKESPALACCAEIEPKEWDEGDWFDDDNDYEYCESCGNLGFHVCRCGGDLCVCDYNGEIPCHDCQ